MDFNNILSRTTNGVTSIRLNRPDKFNALSLVTFSELRHALTQAEADDEVRVVIIGAEGRAFCAGDDLNDFVAGKVSESKAAIRNFARQPLAAFLHVEKLTKPVIAAVHGLAAGGGCELAVACDLIIASEKAKFALPEARIGAFAGFSIHRLPRIVGSKIALEMLLTGDAIDAQEALRVGLVNKVVPETEFEAEATKMAHRVMTIAPLAATVYKNLVHKCPGGSEVEETLTVASLLLAGDEFKGSFAAALSKLKK